MKRRAAIGSVAAVRGIRRSAGRLRPVLPCEAGKLRGPVHAGGTTDIIARAVALKITPNLNSQTMVVENKGGAGGVIGACRSGAGPSPTAIRSAWPPVSTVATLPAIQPATPYKPLTDFSPIINIAATPNVLAVHPSFPRQELQRFPC